MTELGEGLAPPSAGGAEQQPLSCPSLLSVGSSALAVLGSFLVLLQIDIPLMRFLRSLDLSSIQRWGDWGEKLGNGGTLVGISLALFLIGLLWKRDSLRRVAIDSLLAHAVVALLVNGLKHLIGRPRPRLTHGDEWQWWPSWESGLDSFPSGHTSSTVAVVTVLSRVLPCCRGLPFLLVAWVAASRIWRGSHFPSDVVAGMVVGYMVGTVFNSPLRWWHRSARVGLVRVAPAAVAVAGLFWIASHRIVDTSIDAVLVASAFCLVVGGAMLRSRRQWAASVEHSRLAAELPIALTGMGLGVATGAPAIIVLTALIGLARLSSNGPVEQNFTVAVGWKAVLYAGGSVMLIMLIHALKGVIPLR
jgi:undecaprenyl-diphosphatase